MRKKYPFNMLSEDTFCSICGRPLKKRIAEEKPTADKCYEHHLMLKKSHILKRKKG